MRQNNKGFSLIETIIVVAIMAILAAIGVVTFVSCRTAESKSAKNKFVSACNYEKQIVKAKSADNCMVLMKADNGKYYIYYGVATGSTEADLLNSFKTIAGNCTLTQLKSDPDLSSDREVLGSKVSISNSSGVISSAILKYRKFDGSVLFGSGEYTFSMANHPHSTNTFTVDLNKSTGVCVE